MASTSLPGSTGPAARPRRWSRRQFGCLAFVGLPVVLIANEWLIRPLLNPLRRSPEAITAELLQQTPLGIPRSEVEAWVNSQGWPQGGTVRASDERSPIQRSLGSYQSYGMLTHVFVEWRFGPDGRLYWIEESGEWASLVATELADAAKRQVFGADGLV